MEPKTVKREKQVGYFDLKAKQARREIESEPDSPEKEDDEPEFIEYVCIDVEYIATETLRMVGSVRKHLNSPVFVGVWAFLCANLCWWVQDGEVVAGSDLPRDRTMTYTLRGRLDHGGEDYDWEFFDLIL
jgi:hypothetical protein